MTRLLVGALAGTVLTSIVLAVTMLPRVALEVCCPEIKGE